MFHTVRVFYLALDILRYYSIFDKCSQIVGLELIEMHEFKDKLTHGLESLRLKHGTYETFLYNDMINDEYQIYEYDLTHVDVEQLKLINDAKTTRLGPNTSTTIIPISNDMRKHQWFTLRDDIINAFIGFIIDRVFEHEIYQSIKRFNPKLWNVKYMTLGADWFLNVFLNDEIDKLVEFWPRIDAIETKIGLKRIKQLYMNEFMNNGSISLHAFAVHIIGFYRGDATMQPVRILFASFIAILPSAMVLENWNSISTLVWSSLRKLLSCESIHEYVNTKVNGPPSAHYDPRAVASNLANNSRIHSIDVDKHMKQKYLRSFFTDMKKSNDRHDDAIKKLENVNPVQRNTTLSMRQKVKRGSRINSTALSLFCAPKKYQSNITQYFKFEYDEPAMFELNRVYILAHMFQWLDVHEANAARVVSQIWYGAFHWFIYKIPKSIPFHVSVRRVSRDWLVSMAILFRPNNDESDHLDDVAADEDVSAVELQWKDLTVEHFLCLFDEWYRMEPALSKKAIKDKVEAKYQIARTTIKRDVRFKDALERFVDKHAQSEE